MIAMLVFKEKMKLFYSRFEMLLIPVIRFTLSLVTFLIISRNVGFMNRLNSPVILVVLALACSIMPYGIAVIIAGGLILAHISTVSIELTLILSVCMLMVAVLYYGFQPGDSYLLLITPIFYILKIPYAVPLLVGLSKTPVAAVPVGCGTFIYYILQYVKQNAGVLTNDASLDITQKYVQIMKSMISNKLMMLMIVACVTGVLVVYLIRRLSIDYAWMIAIVVGAIAQLTVIFIGVYIFDVSAPMVELLLGTLGSMLIAGIYNFLIFSVDYSRTEYTQFEDDDYYYYVKAVPKLTISTPDVKVQKINSTKARRNGRGDMER
ncbi:MAG: ABC transporter permease [Hungatella sp.]|nr:ABC transporter permease [Hungatella sp.]